MEDLMVPPEFQEMESEEGDVLLKTLQTLKYICEAPLISRPELATKVMGVTSMCLNALKDKNHKLKALEKTLHNVYQRLQPSNGTARIYEDQRAGAEFPDIVVRKQSNYLLPPAINQLPSNPAPSLIGETIWSSTSEYQVENLLSRGLFGVLVRCRKKQTNEVVALKMITMRNEKEDVKEVEILDSMKALGSENFNIVSFNESFRYNGYLCLEFKMLDISLEDYISHHRFLQLKEIRPIIQQLAVALHFLECSGVIHTDLKPDNIMLVDCRRQPLKVKIIDFSLAIRNPEELTAVVFQPLVYRAPEVLLGAPFNHSIDVWSLGCIAAEMLTGKLLFPVGDESEMIQCIISTIDELPDDVLKAGLKTDNYFHKRSTENEDPGWSLKSPGASCPQMSSVKRACGLTAKLPDILTVPHDISPDPEPVVEYDQVCFSDLVVKMLHVDTLKRITPTKILSHPFIKLSHLNHQSYSSYVKSSINCMRACIDWSFDGGENCLKPFNISFSTPSTPRSSSPPSTPRTPNSPDCDVDIQRTERRRYGEEQRLLQVTPRKGAAGLSKKRLLKDRKRSESVFSSKQDGDKTLRAARDGRPTPKEKTRGDNKSAASSNSSAGEYTNGSSLDSASSNSSLNSNSSSPRNSTHSNNFEHGSISSLGSTHSNSSVSILSNASSHSRASSTFSVSSAAGSDITAKDNLDFREQYELNMLSYYLEEKELKQQLLKGQKKTNKRTKTKKHRNKQRLDAEA